MVGGWIVCFLRNFCPAGRAHFAWGGHFVACLLVLQGSPALVLPLVGRE
jgi:hypothetical protein